MTMKERQEIIESIQNLNATIARIVAPYVRVAKREELGYYDALNKAKSVVFDGTLNLMRVAKFAEEDK